MDGVTFSGPVSRPAIADMPEQGSTKQNKKNHCSPYWNCCELGRYFVCYQCFTFWANVRRQKGGKQLDVKKSKPAGGQVMLLIRQAEWLKRDCWLLQCYKHSNNMNLNMSYSQESIAHRELHLLMLCKKCWLHWNFLLKFPFPNQVDYMHNWNISPLV